MPPDAGNLGLNDKKEFIAMFRKTMNDMNLLGEQLFAYFMQEIWKHPKIFCSQSLVNYGSTLAIVNAKVIHMTESAKRLA